MICIEDKYHIVANYLETAAILRIENGPVEICTSMACTETSIHTCVNCAR